MHKDPLEAAEIQQNWLAECAQSAVADWIAIVSPGAEHAAHGRKSTGKPAISVRKASEEVSA